MKTLLLVFLFAAASSAHARLGETEAQIAARYGKALRSLQFVGCPASLYEFNGMKVVVILRNNRSTGEAVISSKEMDDDRCLALMRAISGVDEWKRLPSRKPLDKNWKSENAVAMHHRELMNGDRLMVFSDLLMALIPRDDDQATKKTGQRFLGGRAARRQSRA